MDQHEYDGPRVGDVVRTADGTDGRIVGASGIWSPGEPLLEGDVYVSTADDLICVPVSDVAGFPAIDETDSDHPDNFPLRLYGPDPDSRSLMERGGCNACRRPFDGSGDAVAVLVVRDHYTRFCGTCVARLADAVATFDGGRS